VKLDFPRPAPVQVKPMLRLSSLPLLVLALGCCNNTVPPETPQAPPERPPTPASVTREKPGGDAPDPVKAALQRLLSQPIEAKRRDRWGTLRVPLADTKNWRRIRIWGHPTRATFQYGDDYTAMVVLRYSQIEGPNDPEHCLADFMKYASPVADNYGIRLGESRLVKTSQSIRGQVTPILVRLQEGGVDSLIVSDDYLGLMAAYQSWPGTCLVQGFAVVATDHPDLAMKVRDRWVAEAVGKLAWDKKVSEPPDPSLMR
jgi:hypothetical protein